MPTQDDGRVSGGSSFYGLRYARFGSTLAAELRREVYGEDLGQLGWRTAPEQAEIAELLAIDVELNAQGMAIWLDRA